MESKIVKKKKMEKFDEQFNLIGYRFKKYGFALVGLLIVGFVVVQVFDIEVWPEHKETVKSVFLRLLIIGLLLIAWSKERVEDERSFIRKVKNFARSFIWISIFILLRPLASFFLGEPYIGMGEEVVIISMLIFQIGMIYFEKYNERTSEDEKEGSAV